MYQDDFRVMIKNFKKVLVVWKKLYTFALANREQDDRTKDVPVKRTERSSLT